MPRTAGQAALVLGGRPGCQRLVGEDVLDHEGVDVDQGGLEDSQAQHGQFLLVAAVGGDVAAFAEEDDRVGAVPGLDDVKAFVDLALQVAVAQVAGQEDGALRAAGLGHGLVGGVDGVGLGEPPQDRLGGGGSGADRGGVLDHLVVLGGDQVPPDRPGQRGLQPRPCGGLAGGRAVQPSLVDPLDPGQQVEAEQPGGAESDFGLAVGVGVAGVDFHHGAVPHDALDHCGDLGGGASDELGVDRHRLALNVPVDQPAVAGVPLGEDVLIERAEVSGVAGVAAASRRRFDPLRPAPGQQFLPHPVCAPFRLADVSGQPLGELAAVLGAAFPESQVAADLRPVVLDRAPGPLIEPEVGRRDADLAGNERHRVVVQPPGRAGTGPPGRRTSAAARNPAGSARASPRPGPSHHRAGSRARPDHSGPPAPPRFRDPRLTVARGADKVPGMTGGGTSRARTTRTAVTVA